MRNSRCGKAFLIPLLPLAVLMAAGMVAGQALSPAGSAEKSSATDPGVASSYALGDITAIDPAGKHLTVRTQVGDISAQIDERTQFLRVAPGEKTLERGEPITLADIGVGDRVLARGKVAEDRKSVPARQVIVMSKAAIVQKQEHDREEWRSRSIAGVIAAVDPATKDVTVQMRSREGPKFIVVAAGGKVTFRRYSPDSVKFVDAKPSSFAELKVGDQLRALGEKSEDGTRFQPEEMVSGSFVMVGGPVTAVNAAAGEVIVDNIPTRKPATVVINRDSVLRRIPPQMAAMLAQRGQPPGATQPVAGSPGGWARQGGMRPGGPGGDPRINGERPRMAGGDVQEMLERLPPITIADLKPGDVILVSSTIGANASRVTAIMLAAGIEALLSRPEGSEGVVSGANLGLPSDVLDFDVGLPPN